MKNKKIIKKIIPTIVFGGIVVSSLTTYVLASSGLNKDTKDIFEENINNNQDIFGDFEKIKGYDLKKILKIKDRFLGLYEHQKTGAQIVVIQTVDELKEDESFEIFFRVPSENNKGTNHALEHCILYTPEYTPSLISGQTSFEGITYSVENLSIRTYCYKDILDFNQQLDILLKKLKKPDFINNNNNNIFDIEAHSKHIGTNGQKFIIGRVFSEEQEELQVNVRQNFEDYDGFRTDSKFQFYAGGLPDDILKLEKSEVVDTYNKYIHPSNSLSIISSYNYKEIMNKLDDNYFSNYDKKDINVSFDLNTENPQQKENYCWADKKFKNYNQDLQFKYLAKVFYDLKDLDATQLDQFDLIQNIWANNDDIIKNKGYSDFVIRFDTIHGYPYMVFNLCGNDAKLFEKDALEKNINDFINTNIATLNKDIKLSRFNCYDWYKNESLFDRIKNSFGLYKDPFSNKCFTLNGNIIEETDDCDIILDQTFILENMIPKKTVVFDVDCVDQDLKKYCFNFKTNCEDDLMDYIVLNMLERCLCQKFSIEKGIFYNSLNLDIKNKCLFTTEKIGIELALDILNNNFKELVESFDITTELLDEAKYFLKLRNDLNFSKEQIDNLTVEEIQENLKNISFLGLTTDY